MSISQALLPEFDHEMANTRKTLERVPYSNPEWRPHDKSGTIGWLAAHLATLGMWATTTMQTDELDYTPESAPPPAPKSSEELLATFDKHCQDARAAIAAASDQQLMSPWTFKMNGQPVFTMPKVAVLRSFVMNHMIHHRGQMTVYLRLNGVAVPSLYGPSADEG